MTERVLGPTGGRRRKWALLLAPLAALSLMLVLALGASANVLPGSQFEIDDPGGTIGANLILDAGPGTLDWAVVTQNRKADEPTGANDDSYSGGVKEDTVCPGVTDGSIPNNKSDLKEFGGYFESEVGGPGWLHVYWSRVQDPSGTTNMDFEFNRSTTDCDGAGPSRNVTRTAGDVLLQFDVDRGGAEAHLSRRTWTGSAWGPATVLGASEAIGSINQVAISTVNADGLGALSPRTFGEASFDLSSVSNDDCLSFGSAMLKSRSSDSFTSQLKDFIAPIPVSANNCGAIKVSKTYKHAASGSGDHPQSGVSFTVDGVTKVTDANGEVCFDGLALNQAYDVVETLPTGYSADQELTQSVTPDNSASCADASYGGETVDFGNTPLTDVTITINSQVDGGTMSTIDCEAFDGLDASSDTTSGDIASNTETGLEPQTLTCTIVIDP